MDTPIGKLRQLWPSCAARSDYPVLTIGLNSAAIFSMGGLKVTPDLSLSRFSPEMAAILVLPGGEAWVTQEISHVSKAALATVEQGRPVASDLCWDPGSSSCWPAKRSTPYQ